MDYSELQQKGIDIANGYEKLSLQDRMNIIAETFGCKTASVRTSLCTGKWRGYSDMSLDLDNGSSLWIGTERTPQAKTAKMINECVNGALSRFNPEIVREAKERAAAALLKREAVDNAAAERMGLKPYIFLNVELNNGGDARTGDYLGWYYVTLAVDGNIFGFIETGLCHGIERGVLSENINRPTYFVAGGLKDKDVDFTFNNVGYSSLNGVYQISISDEARSRAEKRLNERIGCPRAEPEQRPSALDKLAAAKEAVARNSAGKADKPKDKSKTGQEVI